ncbi:MAG: energy transducer TonB [Acidobacteriaceae bacterium]
MPATQAQIAFQVGTLSTGQHWAIVLEPNSEMAGFTVAPGYVVPVDTTQVGNIMPNQSGVLGVDNYVAKDSYFAFQNTRNLNQSVFVVSQVPVGKAVSVLQNGAVVFHARITAPVLLVDGNVAADTSNPRALAVLMLMMPKMIQDEFGPALHIDGQGELVASTAALRRHLRFMPSVGGTFSGQTYADADGRAAAVSANIHIDGSGKVTSVSLLHGSGPFASAVTQSLKGARFKPFSDHGNVTPVNGVIQFTLWNDGEAPKSSIGGV